MFWFWHIHPPSPPLSTKANNVLFSSNVTKQLITAPLSLSCVVNWETRYDSQARRSGVRRTCCGKLFADKNFRLRIFPFRPSLAPCHWDPPSSFWGDKVGGVSRVMIHVHIASRYRIRNSNFHCTTCIDTAATLYNNFFCGEGPRSRCYGHTAALRLIVQPCHEDD
jgi:hypothetical protein